MRKLKIRMAVVLSLFLPISPSVPAEEGGTGLQMTLSVPDAKGPVPWGSALRLEIEVTNTSGAALSLEFDDDLVRIRVGDEQGNVRPFWVSYPDDYPDTAPPIVDLKVGGKAACSRLLFVDKERNYVAPRPGRYTIHASLPLPKGKEVRASIPVVLSEPGEDDRAIWQAMSKDPGLLLAVQWQRANAATRGRIKELLTRHPGTAYRKQLEGVVDQDTPPPGDVPRVLKDEESRAAQKVVERYHECLGRGAIKDLEAVVSKTSGLTMEWEMELAAGKGPVQFTAEAWKVEPAGRGIRVSVRETLKLGNETAYEGVWIRYILVRDGEALKIASKSR